MLCSNDRIFWLHFWVKLQATAITVQIKKESDIISWNRSSGRASDMSADLSLKIDTPAESIEALAKEAETLKTKLEEERQKLNDVACE